MFKNGCFIKVPSICLFPSFLANLNLKKDKSNHKNIYTRGAETASLPLMALLVHQASPVLFTTVICGGYHPCHMGSLLPAFNLKASRKI